MVQEKFGIYNLTQRNPQIFGHQFKNGVVQAGTHINYSIECL